jgi:hypothetical protein
VDRPSTPKTPPHTLTLRPDISLQIETSHDASDACTHLPQLHYDIVDQLPIPITPSTSHAEPYLIMDDRELDTAGETHEGMRSLEGGNLEQELLW